MAESKIFASAGLNFSSNNNHIGLGPAPKKPPRKSSSEYVDSDDERTVQCGTDSLRASYPYPKDNERFETVKLDSETNDNATGNGDVIDYHPDETFVDSSGENTTKTSGDDKDSLLLPTEDSPRTPPDMKERKQALEKSISWLRQELLDMRKTDQTLIMQLMNIQMKIHALKTELIPDSPIITRRPAYQTHMRRPSEELLDFTMDEDVSDDNVLMEEELDVEEENGEPVAWREFQRRLSCRRTFSKRGKLPGIIKDTKL